MHTKLKMRRNHGLETTSEPTNTHRSTTSVIISFKGKIIYKRTLIQMRPELQQEYKKHQNQGGDWNHYKCALPRQTSLHLCRSETPPRLGAPNVAIGPMLRNLHGTLQASAASGRQHSYSVAAVQPAVERWPAGSLAVASSFSIYCSTTIIVSRSRKRREGEWDDANEKMGSRSGGRAPRSATGVGEDAGAWSRGAATTAASWRRRQRAGGGGASIRIMRWEHGEDTPIPNPPQPALFVNPTRPDPWVRRTRFHPAVHIPLWNPPQKTRFAPPR